jgi:hypothetical protein
MSKIIYIIIAYILLALSWFLAVLDPILLYIEYIKYLDYLVGSIILEAVTGLGVVVRGSYSSSK